MRDPDFWWRKPSIAAALLAPLAAGYGAIAASRMAKAGARAGVPILCVGNFTVGGAGKTPAAIALARILTEAGERVFCLSRGYGGSVSGPKLVDEHDTAAQVGDEPLLLARVAPTIVAHDRVAGAQLAQAKGASIVVMDDGLQNGAIAKDITLAVVDGRRGIGNRCVFPAGPLRAPLAAQLAHAHALLLVGDEGTGAREVVVAARARGLPVLHGRLVPDSTAIATLRPRKALAFAGIGDPEKFFATVEHAGIGIAARKSFPDHHHYTAEEAAELVMNAEREALTLLTTEKDHARMRGDPALAALCARARVLPVTLVVEQATELRTLALAALKR